MIDCFDGKIVAYTAGFSPNAELANRMLEKAASTLPGNARPLVHVLLQCLLGGFGSVFPQCGLMVFPGVVIVSR